MANLQAIILRNLLNNEQYTRRVVPFLKKEYFESEWQLVFSHIVRFVTKYNKLPTPEALEIEISNDDFAKDEHLLAVHELKKNEPTDNDWLLDQTEKWCQDRAIYLAIMESISIIDGKHKTLSKTALPDLLSKALGVTFNSNVGHDYIADADSRYAFYHTEETRIPFDLEYFNKITKGGLPKKTLSIALASTGVGKSLFMCHHAANVLMQGKNVLYITMEMAEERIAERIDANLLNTPIHQLEGLSKESFHSKIQKLTSKTVGKLIIKEYPTGAAHTGHFRALLEELKLKRSFTPDIIFIDYLNICASSRMKSMGGAINSYSYIKSIAEEIRGLAVETNVPVVTATQSNRDAFGSSDVDLNNTSESFGVPATADLMFALVATEELDELNQIMVKQLKNRFNDPTQNKRFLIGIDRSRMRLYDLESSAQTLVSNNNTAPAATKQTKDFSGFKM